MLCEFFRYFAVEFPFRSGVVAIHGDGVGVPLKRGTWGRPKHWCLSLQDPFERRRDLGASPQQEGACARRLCAGCVLSRAGCRAIVNEFARAFNILYCTKACACVLRESCCARCPPPTAAEQRRIKACSGSCASPLARSWRIRGGALRVFLLL